MGAIKKEIVIRLQSSEKGHKKAIKVAAAVSGVESVTLAGEDKNLLLVIGFGVDSNDLTEKLRRKVGHAEVVELRTVDADELMRAAAANQYPYRYYPGAPPPPAPYYGNAGTGSRRRTTRRRRRRRRTRTPSCTTSTPTTTRTAAPSCSCTS
uniref:HMA domain-containing protein n=1 Tax=Oryza barthii TaxID=65489 RepID=A0A0D3FWU9_9ORYZ